MYDCMGDYKYEIIWFRGISKEGDHTKSKTQRGQVGINLAKDRGFFSAVRMAGVNAPG